MMNAVPPARRPRWMIVDDDSAVLALTEKIARRVTDLEIECFRAPEDALAAFEAEPDVFKFVITDLDMPGMSGLDLCACLRAMSPTLKVLLVTANDSLTEEEIAHKGFCGVVHKPFSVAVLETALKAAAGKSCGHGCGSASTLAKV